MIGETYQEVFAKAEGRIVSLQEVELAHIVAVLEQTGWNKSRSAEILGIERSTLDRLDPAVGPPVRRPRCPFPVLPEWRGLPALASVGGGLR